MGSDLTDYNSERRTLEALAWTSVACFIVEVLGKEKKEKTPSVHRIASRRTASHRIVYFLP